jgi:penicillin-binding protein 1C
LTIRPDAQRAAESIALKYRDDLRAKGIRNIAILVIENPTGKILSWVGGFGYESMDEGMIDAVMIRRSPGSTLKPFIYGLAVDRGLITPKTILYDVERRYAGYKVRNYDETFRGTLPAGDALASSLNSPAVWLLAQLNQGSLLPIVASLGYPGIGREENRGLSVALGAKEISIFDLVRNYTAFSNKGSVVDPYYDAGAVRARNNPIMSPEAAFLVAEMLAQGTRLDLPRSWEFAVGNSRLAWKTGTSFGNFDAHCVGFNPDFTIGVWVGNADRTPSRQLIGAKVAGPILFDLFQALADGTDRWFTPPTGVKVRRVSAESGKLPTELSRHIVTDWFIPGVSSMASCDRFQEFFVDKKTGYAVSDPAGREVERVVCETYPPEAVAWAMKNALSYRPPPPIDPACASGAFGSQGGGKETEPLNVLSPQWNQEFFLHDWLPEAAQRIALVAEPWPDSRVLFWFLDGIHVDQGPVTREFFIVPPAGDHVITCVDDKGRSGSAAFSVRGLE